MTDSSMTNDAERRARRFRWGTGALVVVLTLAIRPESFWTDELSSAFLASQSNWQGMISRLGEMGSEAQMPLHVTWLWLWARIFGTGEWMLRASNVPWAILAAVAWWGLLRQKIFRQWTLWLLISPFVCYYMNEARPYMMTFATSMLSLLAVEMLCAASAESRSSQASVALLIGVGLCAGTSMLNLGLIPGLLAYAWMRSPGGFVSGIPAWVRSHKGLLGGLVLILSCATWYYFLTLIHGHGGQREPFTWVNGAYAIYEMLGFGGLGAPRILLRELSATDVLSQYGALLVAGLAVWGWVLGVVLRRYRDVTGDPTVRAAIAGLAVGGICLAGAAVCFKVSLWGRHFMAVLPFLFLGLASSLESARKGSPLLARIAICGLIGMFAVSAIRQRVLDEYRKDPIREAVTELEALSGRDVPAVALTCPLALWRYGGDSIRAITLITGWAKSDAVQWQKEHHEYILLVHRPDKFDPEGVWTGSLEGSDTKQIWRQGNIRIYRIHGQPRMDGGL